MQTFFKPNDKRWVDLAIWCDENAYKPDCDNDTLYQYLYLLFWMLSHKWKYFKKEVDYDQYCLLGAQTVYFRLKNPKQFDGSGKLQPVKSVLNYIKNVAYPISVTYQQQNFAQGFDAVDDYDAALKQDHMLKEKVHHSFDEVRRGEFEQTLPSIHRIIKNVLKTTPYNKDKLTTHRLYLSCLLTVLNYLRFDKLHLERLNRREDRGMNNDYVIDEMYRELRYQPPILYHLPDHYANYVSTLVNESMNMLSQDLVEVLGSYEPTDDIIKAILSSPLEMLVENDRYD